MYITVILRGGLGNHLFQLATLYSMAKQTGRTPVIGDVPRSVHRPNDHITHCYASFKASRPKNYKSVQQIQEHQYKPHIYVDYLPQINNNAEIVYLSGYFQSWKFFEPYQEDIRRLFGPPEPAIRYLTQKYDPQTAYFIHYRTYTYRADCGTTGFVLNNLETYFERGLRVIKPEAIKPELNPKIIIMTDNLSKAKDLLLPILAKTGFTNVVFAEEDTEHTLWLMSLCKGGIGTNSSFSWWGCFLNQQRNPIILPNRWYANKSRIIGLGDMIFPGVTVIDF